MKVITQAGIQTVEVEITKSHMNQVPNKVNVRASHHACFVQYAV